MLKKWRKSEGYQTFISSLICIGLGLLAGLIVLLIINPAHGFEGIGSIVISFLKYKNPLTSLNKFGNVIVKTVPLILCSLSIIFAYKVGFFNIGAAGQYVVGSACALYPILAWHWPWWAGVILAILGGLIYGVIVGLLKSYFNVNEVISGIMLNWIALYCANMLLGRVKEVGSPYTVSIANTNKDGLIPSLGLGYLFNKNKYVTIAIVLTILIAIAIYIILEKTKFGYELKATGYNKFAAKYCGMKETKNTILTFAIAGALAGLAGAFFYLSGFENWQTSASSVPAMGFNGIAAAFLGGLNPIGSIFSSYFITHITLGGSYLDKSYYCSQISDLITGIIIYFCGFSAFFTTLLNKKKKSDVPNANDENKDKKETKDVKKSEVGGDK